MATVNLLLPAEPDLLADLYALDEELMTQLRPVPDEDGEPWSPLPANLDGEALYEAYQRVVDAMPRAMVDVIQGRMDLVPGVPMLVGADGRTELVQILDVQVDAQDLIQLRWLTEALAAAEGDLAAFLDDVADDRHARWSKGEGTSSKEVSAWVRRALAPLFQSGSTQEEASDKAELLAVVRAGAGRDRIVLTAAQEETYGRYMVALIRASAATRVDAELTAFATGLR
jgi:hypothetical protein